MTAVARNEVRHINDDTVALVVGDRLVLIDAADLLLVAQHKWSLTRGKSGPAYARAYIGGGRKNQVAIRMHRLILVPPNGADVDHINGDGLDNRRANLRVLTRGANLINTSAFKNSRSGIKGVCWYPAYRQWRAYIQVAGKSKSLGYFDERADAIAARQSAEDTHFPDANRRRQ